MKPHDQVPPDTEFQAIRQQLAHHGMDQGHIDIVIGLTAENRTRQQIEGALTAWLAQSPKGP